MLQGTGPALYACGDLKDKHAARVASHDSQATTRTFCSGSGLEVGNSQDTSTVQLTEKTLNNLFLFKLIYSPYDVVLLHQFEFLITY